jgi:hypothetical protein
VLAGSRLRRSRALCARLVRALRSVRRGWHEAQLRVQS